LFALWDHLDRADGRFDLRDAWRDEDSQWEVVVCDRAHAHGLCYYYVHNVHSHAVSPTTWTASPEHVAPRRPVDAHLSPVAPRCAVCVGRFGESRLREMERTCLSG